MLNGHVEIAELLMKELENTALARKDSLLNLAMASGHVNSVRFVLARGADCNGLSIDGLAPLHRAAQGGQRDIVKLLLHLGADVDCADRGGRTPLHHAASMGHADVVDELLWAGANAAKPDWNGDTPLALAENGHWRVITKRLHNALSGRERAVTPRSSGGSDLETF